MPHMLVLSPQLLSLADGYIKGQEELVTLATKNWYDFFDDVPFFPVRKGRRAGNSKIDPGQRPMVPIPPVHRMVAGGFMIQMEQVCIVHQTTEHTKSSKRGRQPRLLQAKRWLRLAHKAQVLLKHRPCLR